MKTKERVKTEQGRDGLSCAIRDVSNLKMDKILYFVPLFRNVRKLNILNREEKELFSHQNNPFYTETVFYHIPKKNHCHKVLKKSLDLLIFHFISFQRLKYNYKN